MHQTWITVPLSIEEMREMWREDMSAVMQAGFSELLPASKQSPQLPDYLTRKEAAKVFRISLVTLHDWSRPNDDRPAVITPIKINGRVRFKRDEVLALLEHSPKYRHRR